MEWCRNKETKKEFLTHWQNASASCLTTLASCVVEEGYFEENTHVKVAYHDPSKTEHVPNDDEMQLAFELICSKASVSKDTKKLVLEFIELLDIRVDEKRVMI
ncbi:CRISPR type III-associated RAMP protein Csm3 [Bienertia sinuspersici]